MVRALDGSDRALGIRPTLETVWRRENWLRVCVCGATEPEFFASREDRMLKKTVVPGRGAAEGIAEVMNANLWPYRVTGFTRSR